MHSANLDILLLLKVSRFTVVNKCKTMATNFCSFKHIYNYLMFERQQKCINSFFVLLNLKFILARLMLSIFLLGIMVTVMIMLFVILLVTVMKVNWLTALYRSVLSIIIFILITTAIVIIQSVLVAVRSI